MKMIKNKFEGIKLLIIAFSMLMAPVCSYADDTATLQNQLNAGNVTLSPRVYNVTGLTVTHTLNLNGATINMIATTGAAIKLTGAGASISNGAVTGAWNYATTVANPSGCIGIRLLADNCSVSKVNLSQFDGYGILIGNFAAPTITGCNISKIGYIGIYYSPEATTTGGSVTNNMIDRSMLSPSTVMQGAVQIRASTTNAAYSTTGWTITGNTIKMPVMPSNSANECLEVRYMTNSTVSGNTFIGGSIGASVVRSSGITVTQNTCSSQSLEGIEFADSQSSTSSGDIINSGYGVGVLLDGSVGCAGINIAGDQISGTSGECIHAYTNTSNVTIKDCTLTTNSGAKAINLQQTSGVTITNTAFVGNSAGTLVVLLDTCPGNVSMTGGSISNFTSCVVSIYSAKAGQVVNNVTMSGVTVANVPKALLSTLSNGATLGSNIVVVNK